jgi:hypothetical protein
LRGHVNAVNAVGQVDIHEHQVGLMGCGQGHGLRAQGGGPHHLIVQALQVMPEHIGDQLFILNQQQTSDGHRRYLGFGV